MLSFGVSAEKHPAHIAYFPTIDLCIIHILTYAITLEILDNIPQDSITLWNLNVMPLREDD